MDSPLRRLSQRLDSNELREGFTPSFSIDARILGLDPGETTGWVLFENAAVTSFGELITDDIPVGQQVISDLLQETKPLKVIVEDYRIYAWRAKQHKWASLHTPRLIGAIEVLCAQLNLPLHKQMAQAPKGFFTDKRLKEWDLYVKGPHARDAVRHVGYWLLFVRSKETG